MAIPNPFRRWNEHTVSSWNYTFDFTPEHPTEEDMRPLKFSYDVLAEQAFEEINRISPPPHPSAIPRNQDRQKDEKAGDSSPPRRDLYEILKDNHADNEILTKFWNQLNEVPDWVDWDQIARGQDVFYRYGGANLTGLAYQSLLGGMGAGRVVETLARTGGFSTKVAKRRLYETTQHILQVTKNLESIQPGGDGWASTIRVRLLHSAVRNRIMKLAKQRPEYYDVEKFGVPINDLDSLATISTFSATLIWMSLPRQGIFMLDQEIADYLALWRYVAHVIGCPTEPLADMRKTRVWLESMFYYEVKPSPTSKILANNIIAALSEQPPVYVSSSMLIASARWLNGNELCDALGLPRPPYYFWALMAGQCVFFATMCYWYRWFLPESSDKRKLEFMRKIFWGLIVEHESGLRKETVFDFKYVPEFETLTKMADEGSQAKVKAAALRPTELRNMRWLLLGVGVLGAGTWVWVKALGWAIRLLWR